MTTGKSFYQGERKKIGGETYVFWTEIYRKDDLIPEKSWLRAAGLKHKTLKITSFSGKPTNGIFIEASSLRKYGGLVKLRRVWEKAWLKGGIY